MSRGTIGGQRLPAPMELGRKRSNIIRTLPVKAGESVAAGDVVDVIGGAVGKGLMALENEKTTFGNTNYTRYSICKLKDTLFAVCFAYSIRGAAIPCVISNGKPTFPISGADFSSGDSLKCTACDRLSNTQFVVGYVSGDYFSYNIGTVSGSEISFSGGVTVCSSGVTEGTVVSLSASTVLSIYNQSGLKARVNSGTVASLPGTSSASCISACRLPDSGSNKRVCVCYADGIAGGPCKAVICTISGSNTMTWGTPITFYADNGAAVSCCFDGEYVVAYSTDNTGSGRGGFVCAIKVSGSTLTPGTALNIPSSEGGGSAWASILPILGKVILLTGRNCFVMNRSGNVVTLDSKFTPLSGGSYVSSAKIGENKLIQCYADSANSNYGAATLLEVRDNQIAGGFEESSSEAIALQSGSGGQNIDIIYDGVAELPGITAGTSIDSPGVRGYAPVDGVLWVGPEWDSSHITGSYADSGTTERTIDIGFSPSALILSVGTDGVEYSDYGSYGWDDISIFAGKRRSVTIYKSGNPSVKTKITLTETGFSISGNGGYYSSANYIAFR